MSKTNSITAERVRELLNYNPETGVFTWRQSRNGRVKIGSVAGTIATGYVRIRLDDTSYKAHRLAWLYMHGSMPDEIDHANGNCGDNRIANLRDVTHTENLRNKRRYKNNTSGAIGVAIHPATGKWRATIRINKNKISLGLFSEIADAIAARKAAEIRYGFHANHGRSKH